ncbi:MAG TPA: GNAT family N-acetyltransferase [Thermotogota bacterium]|nr:GNAT family N-acetyltransferase [Thermotogota bacterium]
MEQSNGIPIPLASLTRFQCPGIDSVSLRFCAGPEDAPAFFRIHENRVEVDGVDRYSNREDYYPLDSMKRVLLSESEQHHLHLWPVVEIDHVVVAFGTIEPWEEEDGMWVFLIQGWVDPSWRGKGIGTALIRWSEDYVKRLIASEHPGARAELAANASSTEVSATQLLLNEGYFSPFTVLEFCLDPAVQGENLPLEEGLSIKAIDDASIGKMVQSVKEAYESESEDGRYVEPLVEETYLEEITQPPHDRSIWQVAWDGQQIAGQVIPVIGRHFGEIFEVSVRKPWRRKGIARALLLRAIKTLKDRGVQDIRVYTLSTFPTKAKDLYQSVGFQLRKEFARYRKPL